MVARKKESPIFYLIGVPANFNLWGERSTSKYLLLKRGLSTYTRIVPARESPYFLCSHAVRFRAGVVNPTSWVRAVCAGCAMRGVGCAPAARGRERERAREILATPTSSSMMLYALLGGGRSSRYAGRRSASAVLL